MGPSLRPFLVEPDGNPRLIECSGFWPLADVAHLFLTTRGRKDQDDQAEFNSIASRSMNLTLKTNSADSGAHGFLPIVRV